MTSVVITTDPLIARHTRRALASVHSEIGCMGVECIIVHDGFPENQVIVEETPECNRFTAVTGKDRTGVSAARNIGWFATSGDWIKFLDADDWLTPYAIQTFEAYQRAGKIPDRAAVLFGAQIKVVNGLLAGVYAPSAEGFARHLRKVNPGLVSMAFIRRKALEEVGGFDERIHFEEDWELWLKLAKAGWAFAMTPIPFCYYWIDDAERAAKVRDHTVEGMDVRAWLAKTYGIEPVA